MKFQEISEKKSREPYLIRLAVLENSIVQLQERSTPASTEKATASGGIKHLSLSPESDGLATEVNLTTVRAHDKVVAQSDGATAIGGIAGASRAGRLKAIPVCSKVKRG